MAWASYKNNIAFVIFQDLTPYTSDFKKYSIVNYKDFPLPFFVVVESLGQNPGNRF
jgi:hypothetical protein